jgi:uncharacterized protein
MLPGMKNLALAAILLALCTAVVPAQNAGDPAAPPAHGTLAKRSWLIRTLPPRATFANDMTDAEKKLMQEHVDYWKARFDAGVCLMGGPVFAAKGAYGLLIVRAGSEEEARAIAEGDPSIQAGLNKFDVSEMHVLFPALDGARE